MIDLRLFLIQRISALVMVPLVLGHLVVMIYAIQGGLSAEEILGRTKGSVLWFLFYGLFVLAVSVHGAIGLRTILHEWGRLPKNSLGFVMAVIFLGLLWLGFRAVWAVTFA